MSGSSARGSFQSDIAWLPTGWTLIYRREFIVTKEGFLTNFARAAFAALVSIDLVLLGLI